MVRYFYAWIPYVIVGAVVFLALPWLGLLALLIVAPIALAALVGAVVLVPYVLVRTVSHGLHSLSGAHPRTAPALSPARHQSA